MHQQRRSDRGCLVCEAWALGDLCPRCQSVADDEPPLVLIKRTPPKGDGDYGINE